MKKESEETCEECGKKSCVCEDKKDSKTFDGKHVLGKKVKEKKRHIAEKMSGKKSLASTGRNEGENMTGNNTLERNRA